MPETYTKEQIADIATALYGWTALPRILPSAPGTGPDWDIGADIRAILSALSAAEQERDALKAQVAELEARMQSAGWISVKEQLPPMKTVFDVWDDYHKRRLADHGAFTGHWDDDFRRETMLIKGHTHWMPLPEPPAIMPEPEEGMK